MYKITIEANTVQELGEKLAAIMPRFATMIDDAPPSVSGVVEIPASVQMVEPQVADKPKKTRAKKATPSEDFQLDAAPKEEIETALVAEQPEFDFNPPVVAETSAPAAAKTEEKPAITLDDLQKAFRVYAQKNGLEKAAAMLKTKTGVQQLSKLKPEQYSDAMALVK